MDLSKVKGVYGISAQTRGTRQGVTWNPRLGVAASTVEFPLADIAYTFRVACTGSGSKSADLDLVSGTVSILSGSPVISGGSTDFQATLLPSMAYLHAVLLSVPTTNASSISVAVTLDVFENVGQTWFTPLGLAEHRQILFPGDGLPIANGDVIDLVFSPLQAEIEITVIGRTAA